MNFINRFSNKESFLHKLLKFKVAESLELLNYKVEMEKRVKNGIIDIYAIKKGREIKIEIIKTHLPNWIILRAVEKKSKSKKIEIEFQSEIIHKNCGTKNNIKVGMVTSKKGQQKRFCKTCKKFFYLDDSYKPTHNIGNRIETSQLNNLEVKRNYR